MKPSLFQQIRTLCVLPKNTIRFCWRAFRASCNTILGLYLILQFSYLLLGLLSVRIALPKRVLSLLDEEFSRAGIVYEAKSLEIDASGIVYLNKASFSMKGIPGRFFSADWVGVRFSLLGIILGDADVKGLMVNEGRLLCPAIYSPTGSDEELLGQMSLDLKRSKSWWSLRHCAGMVLGVPTFARGFADIEILQKLDFLLRDTSSVDAARFGEFYDELLSWKGQLDLLQEPSLLLDLAAADQGFFLKVTCVASGLETNQGFFSGPCIASCALSSDLSQSIILEEPLRVSLEKLASPGRFSAEKAWIVTSAMVDLGSFIATIDEPYAVFSGFQIGEDTFSSAGIWADPALLPFLEGEVWGAHGNSFFDAFVDWDWETISGEAIFRASVLPEDLRDLSVLSEWTSYLDGIHSPKLIQASGVVRAHPDFELDLANVWMHTHSAQVWGAPVYYASAHIQLSKQDVLIEDAYVVGANWTGKGVYWQDWKSLDYRFRMNGSLDPDFVSAWMPDFWRGIWRPFHFKSEAPGMDMDLRGNWEAIEDLSFFSSFKASDFLYSGQYVPQAEGLVSVVYNYVSLDSLDIRGRQGACTGWVDWLYVKSEDGPIIVRAELDSALPLEYYTVFDYARSTAEQFSSTTPPHLLIKGSFASETYFPEDRTEYTVIADAKNPVSFLDIPLDSLQFEAKKSLGVLHVDQLAFEFAKGQGGGIVSWDATHAALEFDMFLNKADRDLILSSLPYFESFKDPLGKESKEGDTPGLLSLTVDVKGDPDDWGTFIGKGTVLLEEEDLGRINLLGGMSQFLNAILVIPLTSMSLNKAESSFTLESNVLTFPDGIVSGPTAKIMARGTYVIPDQWLDFKLRVYPLAKVPIIAQALLILAPLSEMFSLHLEGPVSDLDWSFTHASTKQEPYKRGHFARAHK